MTFYQWNDICLCDRGGKLPAGAELTDAPFAPLVFLVERDPRQSRGLYRIDAMAQLEETADPFMLQRKGAAAEELDTFLAEHGAAVLNTAFDRCWQVLERTLHPRKSGFRVNLVGLGDVGGTVLQGLKLLGREIDRIGIYDPNEAACRRYRLELNQFLPEHDGDLVPRVEIVAMEDLFDCDALLFTASLGVPAVGTQVADVRMIQYSRNRDMLKTYAKLARDSDFAGLFCQISDPVDHLCRAVFLASNRDETGVFDARGLLPEQVQGYGLGVMRARAGFYAAERGVDFSHGYAFGPHGKQLIVANATGAEYDHELSMTLTQDTVTANLKVRDLGYKPYIAPGISSAAISVLRTLRGEFHDGAMAMDGAYFGCRLRSTTLGVQPERVELHPALLERMRNVYESLRGFDYEG